MNATQRLSESTTNEFLGAEPESDGTTESRQILHFNMNKSTQYQPLSGVYLQHSMGACSNQAPQFQHLALLCVSAKAVLYNQENCG